MPRLKVPWPKTSNPNLEKMTAQPTEIVGLKPRRRKAQCVFFNRAREILLDKKENPPLT